MNRIAAALATLPFYVRSYIEEVAAYLDKRENGRLLPGYSYDQKRLLVARRHGAGRLAVEWDSQASVSGVLMWYRFKSSSVWEQVRGWAPDDDDGDNIFLAFAAADSPDVVARGILQLIAKEPDVLTRNVCGMRRGRLVEYDAPKLFSRLIKYGRR